MIYAIGDLKDVKLIKNKLNDSFYPYSLTVTYETKDEMGNIHELVIKNVGLPIYLKSNYISYKTEISNNCIPERSVNIGYGKIDLSENTIIEDKIIKYAEKEMTIEEIEKKLGHKIKIVGEKGE